MKNKVKLCLGKLKESLQKRFKKNDHKEHHHDHDHHDHHHNEEESTKCKELRNSFSAKSF